MDAKRSAQLQRIADRLRVLPLHERDVALRKLCGDDAELLAAVRSLLRTSIGNESALPGAALPKATASPRTPAAYEPRITGYEFIGPLGEGGMGVVWEAVQLSTRRRIAIKLLSEASLGSQR